MVERTVSNGEALGSIPKFSTFGFFLHRADAFLLCNSPTFLVASPSMLSINIVSTRPKSQALAGQCACGCELTKYCTVVWNNEFLYDENCSVDDNERTP